MELRNSERTANQPLKCNEGIMHGLEIQDSAESMFSKCFKGREENVQSTCVFRDAENVKVRKERKRLEQFNNMDDAILRKYKKYDGLEQFKISEQSRLNCELESSLVKHNNTSCQEIRENINSNYLINVETLSNNFPNNSIDTVDTGSCMETLCPICSHIIQIDNIRDRDLAVNTHIDVCLNNRAISNLTPNPHDHFSSKNKNCNERNYRQEDITTTTTSSFSTKAKVPKSNSILRYMINSNKLR